MEEKVRKKTEILQKSVGDFSTRTGKILPVRLFFSPRPHGIRRVFRFLALFPSDGTKISPPSFDRFFFLCGVK